MASFFGDEDDPTFLSLNSKPNCKTVLTRDVGFYYTIYGSPHAFLEVFIYWMLLTH